MLNDYEEFFVLPNTLVFFKAAPSKENLDELRSLIDKIQETNKDFPL